MATAYEHWARLRAQRAAVIDRNRSRRMRGREPLPVPPKPKRPTVPVAYGADGSYVGRLSAADELPPGCKLKWEAATW